MWPTYKGKYFDSDVEENRPLVFFAQFNCAEIARFDTEHLLPDHGLLSFFASMIFVPRQTADAFIGLRTLRCCLRQIILRM